MSLINKANFNIFTQLFRTFRTFFENDQYDLSNYHLQVISDLYSLNLTYQRLLSTHSSANFLKSTTNSLLVIIILIEV